MIDDKEIMELKALIGAVFIDKMIEKYLKDSSYDDLSSYDKMKLISLLIKKKKQQYNCAEA